MFFAPLIPAVVLLASFQQARPEADIRAAAPIVFEGFVLEADGSPAVEAVVVSSAGGEAVTGLDGSYRLEVHVPPAALEVEIMVVGEDGRRIEKRVQVVRPREVVPVDPLAFVWSPRGGPCWKPTFGGLPGVEDTVHALATFDDGSGPELYAGGSFRIAGGIAANHVAKWDGSRWARLGGGVSGASLEDPGVSALAVFDDGSGAALYAGGTFTTAGGAPANHIAKWDGSSWSALGSGVGGGLAPSVRALAVFDDGSGPALYAGGTFTTAGGSAANRIAKWDGASWSAVGTGTNAEVRALVVFDDGSGPALYAGGQFTSAGGAEANRVAKWDGSSWSALGTGMNSIDMNGLVRALAVFDDGGGPALYAGGHFTIVGGNSARRIAKWDGSSWTALGTGVDKAIIALCVFDDGTGPALYAGGEQVEAGGNSVQHIAKWNGTTWSPLGSGTNEPVHALAVFDDGGGPALFAGGDFQSAFFGSVGVEAQRIARWDGAVWSALGGGKAPSDSVQALTVFDDGSGPALFAGGTFDFAGGVPVFDVAKWSGSSWSPLGFGLAPIGKEVRALAVFDDGTGPALYLGGEFLLANLQLVKHVAKWDGSSLSPLGIGMDTAPVTCLAVFDDGTGPALYAGGNFTTAGQVTANHVAKWDGANWSALGSGTNGAVSALAVFDDGTGPALYAGGSFTTAGGTSARRIARWDGANWSGLITGTNGTVSALAAFDDGSGPALYVGGSFTMADGFPMNHIARWSGLVWTTVGSGTNDSVCTLAVFDDGNRPALFAGGTFTTAGGTAANRIARWDGSSWEPLGRGTSGKVAAMAIFGNGPGASLCVGGSFASAYDSGDSYLARWVCRGVVREAFHAR